MIHDYDDYNQTKYNPEADDKFKLGNTLFFDAQFACNLNGKKRAFAKTEVA